MNERFHISRIPFIRHKIFLTLVVRSQILLAIFCFLSVTERLPAQWVNAAGDSAVEYSQIIFVDSTTAYIAATVGQFPNSHGAVFVTTDGGDNWVKHRFGIEWLSSVSAIGHDLVWTASYGVIYASHDGGMSWDSINVLNPTYQILTVQFVDSLNGWVIGKGAYGPGEMFAVAHSSDGGISWQKQDSGTCEYFCYTAKGYFTDSLHGWRAGAYAIGYTTDGGRTWPWAPTDPPEFMQDVFFLDTLKGWAVGSGPSITATKDGGRTWQKQYWSHSFYPYLRSVFFADSLHGWACGDSGVILSTVDGGTNWKMQRRDASGKSLNSIFFLNENVGWAVGDGIILHTTNGGGVSVVEEPELHLNSLALFQNYPNPFNPSTTIGYELSAASYVILKVCDVLGREIATLVEGKETGGRHTVIWNASKFPSGVYFYRLMSISSQGTFVITKHMMLIK